MGFSQSKMNSADIHMSYVHVRNIILRALTGDHTGGDHTGDLTGDHTGPIGEISLGTLLGTRG